MDNNAGEAAKPSAPGSSPAVHVAHDHMTFDAIRTAIYDRARELYERKVPISTLHLGRDLYEILNKRLVFRTAAHRELPHFITPSGSLRVPPPEEGAVQTDCFVID